MLPRRRYCSCGTELFGIQDRFVLGFTSKMVLTQQASSRGLLGELTRSCEHRRYIRVIEDSGMFSYKNAFGTYLILGLQIYDPASCIPVIKKCRVLFWMTWAELLVISRNGSPFWGCRYHWTSDRSLWPLQCKFSEPGLPWDCCDCVKLQNKTNCSLIEEYSQSSFLVMQSENHKEQSNREMH